MQPETPKASHTTPHVWRETKCKSLKWDKSTSRDFIARSAASQPKKAHSARQEVDLQQVYNIKSQYTDAIQNNKTFCNLP